MSGRQSQREHNPNQELLNYNNSKSQSSSRNASVPDISVAGPKSDRSIKSSPKQKTPRVKKLYSDHSASKQSQKSK